MTRKTQVLIGGGAVVAAALYIVLSSSESMPGRGYYDERGHYVVPLNPEDRRRLAPRPPAHRRQSQIVDFVEQKLKSSPSLDGLPAGCRAVWSTWRVEAAVDNGGFDHFFGLSPDPVPAIALEGFRVLRAPAYADLMQRAIAIHEQGKERTARMALYAPLDEAFYKLGDSEPLDGLRARYIDAHPEEFPR